LAPRPAITSLRSGGALVRGVVVALWGWLGLAVVAWALFGGVGEAQAQGASRYRVYVRAPVEFYPDLGEGAGRGSPPTRHLQVAIERAFAAESARFEMIPTDALFQSPTVSPESAGAGRRSDTTTLVNPTQLILALNRAEGIVQDARRAFSRYDLASAETMLVEVIDTYESLLFPLLNPTDLARVYETLGLVLWETTERRDETLEAFRNMIRLDSRRVLVAPYFPEPIAAAYRSAQQELLGARSAGPDPTDAEVLRNLGEVVGADVVVWAYVVERGEALELVMQLYRRDSGVFLAPERVALTGDAEVDAERATRLSSRFTSCLEPLPEPVAPVAGERAFYLQSGFSYLVFFRGPSDQAFDNYGFALSGTYLVLGNFTLRLGLDFLTSGSDYEQDLQGEFSTIRGFVGGGFSFPVKRWLRPFVNFSLEGSRIGEIKSTDSFYCKVNPDDPRQCRPEEIEAAAPGFLMGVNIQVGLSVLRFRSLSLFAAANGSFFVVPFADREVDLPLGFDVGIEYEF